MGFRRNVHGFQSSESPEFKPGLGMLPLWDMSLEPVNNSSVRERLGIAAKVRGVAVVGIDEDTGASVYADGITHKRQKQSVAPFDPDAFVYRLFTDRHGEFGTWMPRLTLDMDGPQYGGNCRSTILTDNDDEQQIAWLTDVMNLVDIPGIVGDRIGEGLAYDQAGFLESLYEKEFSFAATKRAAAALSVHKNKGFINDAGRVGQLRHILCIGDVKGTAAAAGGRQRQKDETLLRADAGIYFGKAIGTGRFVHQQAKADDGDDNDPIRRVRFQLEETAPSDEHFDTSADPNCDHGEIPKSIAKKKILGWVKVPRYTPPTDTHHYDYSYHHDHHDGDESSSGGSDVPTGGAPTPASSGTDPAGSDPTATDPLDVDSDDVETEGQAAARKASAAEEFARRTQPAQHGWTR